MSDKLFKKFIVKLKEYYIQMPESNKAIEIILLVANIVINEDE